MTLPLSYSRLSLSPLAAMSFLIVFVSSVRSRATILGIVGLPLARLLFKPFTSSRRVSFLRHVTSYQLRVLDRF